MTVFRKKQDELAQERFLEGTEEIESDNNGDHDDSAPAIDFNACNLKVQIKRTKSIIIFVC